MQLSLDPNKDHYYITAYQPGQITINDASYSHSIIVASKELITDWQPQTVSDVQPSDLAAIAALEPEIVLLGTGPIQQFPSLDIMAFFYQRQIGIEVMHTHAACRTFNVLVSEGRKVVAGLLLG